MYPNLGTPKNNFFNLEQMENLLFLGIPILKHITVLFYSFKSYCSQNGQNSIEFWPFRVQQGTG